MARTRGATSLAVYLNARRVGTLTRAASGALDFQYHSSWLVWQSTFAISLALPLREDRYVGATIAAVFDNLLPDNDLTRRRIAAHMQADGIDVFNLLAVIGRDCVGALQFLPDGTEPGPAGEITGQPISLSDVAGLLRDLEVAPLGMDLSREFRISLAGAQEKTALLYQNDQWYLPHGSTPTTHIVKPQMGFRAGQDLSQSVENEFLCARILNALALPVAKTSIVDFDDQRALVVERFDRHWTRDSRLLRLPQEDCCQALGLPPTRRYQSDGGPGIADILELLKGSDRPQEDQKRFLKAQMVFWLLGATDGHAKNFSVFINAGGGFHMTPLYDVSSTQPLLNGGTIRRTEMKMAMAIGDKLHYRVDEILPRHFVQSAAKAGVPRKQVNEITEELADSFEAVLASVEQTLPKDFPERLFAAISAGVRGRLPRLSVDRA